MKAFSSFDHCTQSDIKARQIQLKNTIELAAKSEKSGQLAQAIFFYRKARNLSTAPAFGLNIQIINETSDFNLWNELNSKLEKLSYS